MVVHGATAVALDATVTKTRLQKIGLTGHAARTTSAMVCLANFRVVACQHWNAAHDSQLPKAARCRCYQYILPICMLRSQRPLTRHSTPPPLLQAATTGTTAMLCAAAIVNWPKRPKR